MKNLNVLLACFLLNFVALAQSPAGKSLFIDYSQYQTDGLLRYVNCGNDNSLNPGDSLSMEVWIKVSQQSVNDNVKILGKVGPQFNSGYLLGKEASELYAEVWNPVTRELKAGFMSPMAHWAHMVCTFAKGGKMKAYLNGVFVGESNAGSNGIEENSNDLIIGIAPWDLANFQFFGEIDNVRLWNKELSENEITYLMHRNLSGLENGLMAYYEFEDNTNDLSPNQNDGTVQNMTTDNFSNSMAVIADSITENLNDVRAVWLGLSTGTPTVSQLTDFGLTLSADVYGDEHLLFAHNGSVGTSVEDLPSVTTTNFIRAARTWYLQSEGLSIANLNFSLSNTADGGDELNDAYEAEQYVLLYRSNLNEEFQAIKAGNIKISDVISFESVSVQTGYYSIAVGDEALEDLLSISQNSFFDGFIYPNPNSGVFTIKNSQPATIQIYNTLGERILQYPETSSQIVNMQNYSKGVYFIYLISDREKLYKRILIQ